jgi:putative FmdB family regulatory protein
MIAMPLYEYKCTQCKRHTEKIQKFSDPEITACPHCGGLLERVISAPAISFKGGGWYADGYGNAKPASSSDSKSDAPSDSKSESKPAAKSDSSASSSSDSANSSSSSDTKSTPAAAPAPAAPSSSDKK